MQRKPHKTLSQKLFSGSLWALFTMFVWELVEEGLEQLIAFCISEVIALFFVKALSALAIIGFTQGIKVCLKRFLVPVVKKITYKEGHDKMSKIKKFFTWIWCNKKSLIGVLSATAVGLSGTGVIPVDELPALPINGVNITPYIYYALLCVLTLIGVFGCGFEKIEEFFARIGLIKAEKEQKAIEKEAAKEIAEEQKKATQSQAEKEKAEAKAEAERLAQEEKEKAEAEHRAKVDEAKQKLLAKQAEEQAKLSAEQNKA